MLITIRYLVPAVVTISVDDKLKDDTNAIVRKAQQYLNSEDPSVLESMTSVGEPPTVDRISDTLNGYRIIYDEK